MGRRKKPQTPQQLVDHGESSKGAGNPSSKGKSNGTVTRVSDQPLVAKSMEDAIEAMKNVFQTHREASFVTPPGTNVSKEKNVADRQEVNPTFVPGGVTNEVSLSV